ncbi:hypothetical protein CFOL_v3_18140 [Cephalotus follicularis]|uniref:Zf-RVT domain-containing protein n=1 Tax=Cephalotus follicularis TaxID=3775 RepID=A0A1Q3C350_CEPFO|nr:hypothetical protein CFOL_v3_18140 [Cephalotus follicularis]
MHEQSLLWVRVISTKYMKDSYILDITNNPSQWHAWRSISKGISSLRKGLVWKVGDGSSIKVWSDNWLGFGPLADHIVGNIPEDDMNIIVADLIDLNWNWNLSSISPALSLDITTKIYSLPIPILLSSIDILT